LLALLVMLAARARVSGAGLPQVANPGKAHTGLPGSTAAQRSPGTSPKTIFVFLQGMATRLSGCPTSIQNSPFSGLKAYLAAQAANKDVVLREGYELLDFSYVAEGASAMPGTFTQSGMWCPVPFTRLQSGRSLADADKLLTAMLGGVSARYAGVNIPVRFVLIGHSKGGVVAADVASQRADLPIAQVITIDSPLLGINTGAAILTQAAIAPGSFSAKVFASLVLAGTRLGSFLDSVFGMSESFLSEMTDRWHTYQRDSGAYAQRMRTAVQAHGAQLLTISNSADIAVPTTSAVLPGGPTFEGQVITPADVPLMQPYIQSTGFAPSTVFPALAASEIMKLVTGGAGISDTLHALGDTVNDLHGALLHPTTVAVAYSSAAPHWHVTPESPDPSYMAIYNAVLPFVQH
jgi:hypothetical protein